MSKKESQFHDAPRLRAYLERTESSRLLRMNRSEWFEMKSGGSGIFQIDLNRTPMASVTTQAAIIASTAEEISPSESEIHIYRYDPRDSKPYNVDTFSVWENLPSNPNFFAIVAIASTSYDDNMRDFLEENVFIIPRKPNNLHWLDENELPLTVRCLFSPSCSGDV
jgi:hypothetical protein